MNAGDNFRRLAAASVFVFCAQANAMETGDGAMCPAETVRNAPEFPLACMSVEGADHQVMAYFDIDEAGRPINVEIRDFTDACFVEASAEAVRGWRYSCEFAGATGKQTRLRFEKAPPEVASEKPPLEINIYNERDVRKQNAERNCATDDFIRMPPAFPPNCMRHRGKNSVTLRFDIDGDGVPQNIEAIESTQKCFIRPAKKSVSEWRYKCDGVGKEGVEATVTFETR